MRVPGPSRSPLAARQLIAACLAALAKVGRRNTHPRPAKRWEGKRKVELPRRDEVPGIKTAAPQARPAGAERGSWGPASEPRQGVRRDEVPRDKNSRATGAARGSGAGIMGPRERTAPGGPAGRSPPGQNSRATGAARGSGAGIMGPRERTAPGGPAGRSPPGNIREERAVSELRLGERVLGGQDGWSIQDGTGRRHRGRLCPARSSRRF